MAPKSLRERLMEEQKKREEELAALTARESKQQHPSPARESKPQQQSPSSPGVVTRPTPPAPPSRISSTKSLRERLMEEERKRQEELDAMHSGAAHAEDAKSPTTPQRAVPQAQPQKPLSLKERLQQEEKRRQEELAALHAREEKAAVASAIAAPVKAPSGRPQVSLSMRERVLEEQKRRRESQEAATATAVQQPQKPLSLKERLQQEEKRRQEELAALGTSSSSSEPPASKAQAPAAGPAAGNSPQKPLSLRERLMQEEKRRQEELAALSSKEKPEAPSQPPPPPPPQSPMGWRERFLGVQRKSNEDMAATNQGGAKQVSQPAPPTPAPAPTSSPSSTSTAQTATDEPPQAPVIPPKTKPLRSLRERLLEETKKREEALAAVRARDSGSSGKPVKSMSLKERVEEMEKLRRGELEDLKLKDIEELEQQTVAKIRSHVRNHVNGMTKASLMHVSSSFSLSEYETSPEAAIEALGQLKEGNTRFLGREGEEEAIENQLTKKPRAVVITCADSRILPELVFEQSLGDLYVTRAAHYTLDEATKTSLMCGLDRLGAPLLVVMGHEGCHALGHGEPERTDENKDDEEKEATKEQVMTHVNRMVDAIKGDKDVKKSMSKNGVRVVGCYCSYDGQVSFSDEAIQAESAFLAVRQGNEEQDEKSVQALRQQKLNREKEAARTARIKARLTKLRAEREVARAAELEAFWAAEEAEWESRGSRPEKRVKFADAAIMIGDQPCPREEATRPSPEPAPMVATVGAPVEQVVAEAGAAEDRRDSKQQPEGAHTAVMMKKPGLGQYLHQAQVTVQGAIQPAASRCLNHVQATVAQLRLTVQPKLEKFLQKEELWVLAFCVIAALLLFLLWGKFAATSVGSTKPLPVDPLSSSAHAHGVAKRVGQVVVSRMMELSNRSKQMVALALDLHLI